MSLGGSLQAIPIGYNSPGSGTFGDPNSSTYTVSYNTVADGVNLSGVVEISSPVGTCTGELLSDGVSILTAAHCLLPQDSTTGVLPSSVQVYFNYPGCSDYPYCGVENNVPTSNMFLDPTWIADGENLAEGNDLAVLRLTAPAPAFATGYTLFTGDVNSIDLSTPIELAGVGDSGAGQIDGTDYPYGPYIRQGESNYIGTCASNPVLGSDCTDANNLIAQFYAGSPLSNQVEIAGGDSGGPSFYNGQLIGVHEFTDCALSSCPIDSPSSYWGDTYVGGSNAAWIESVEASVPEPATFTLLALGFGGLLFIRRRRAVRI
jgi:hypothetical protein